MFTRYFRTNLRPVIIGAGIAAAAYALISGGSAFSDIHDDRNDNLGNLVPFDIALGAVYMAVAAIELFGIFGAIRQSLPIIRIYAMLSLVAAAMAFGAEVLRLVVHFKFKGEIINACIADVNSLDVQRDSDFSATDYCNDSFSHATFSDIAWLVVSLILSLIFASLAFSYYHQLLDPTSGVARSRPAADNVPLDTFRNYGQYGEYAAGSSLPYNGGGARQARRAESTAPSEYVPPYEASKLPGYQFGAEEGDPDKKVYPTDEEKDLGGVPHA